MRSPHPGRGDLAASRARRPRPYGHDGDMLDLSLFLRGLLIGFSIAAPVGPIGVLCIRRTLANGRVYGFVVRSGRGHGRCLLRFHRGAGVDVDLGVSDRSGELAQAHRRIVFVLSGDQDVSIETGGRRRPKPYAGTWLAGRVHLDAVSDPHQPADHPLFCGHLRRVGRRREPTAMCGARC